MSAGAGGPVGEVSPVEAWRLLESDDRTVLIDVRTRAEWGFVGVPDLKGVARPLITVE